MVPDNKNRAYSNIQIDSESYNFQTESCDLSQQNIDNQTKSPLKYREDIEDIIEE